MTALLYLLQVNIYLVLFYGLYLLLLRKETFFKLNRLYLVGSALLSLSIPLLKAGWIKDLFVTEKIYQVTQSIGYTINKISFTMPAVTDNGTNHLSRLAPTGPDALNASQVFWIVYGLITAIFLLNFLRKLYLVNRAFKENPKYQAFSFFNKVMVDEKLKGRETILDHEMVHVRQWHSADVIFFELFSAFNWFNPIAFTYKKAIRNIHEFIADETAAATLDDKAEYALLLVSNAFGTQTQKLTNSFYNDSLLKRRLIMLNKDKSKKVAVLKYGLSVPLFAIMVICSSATIEKSVAVQAVVNSIENGIPIVVDVLSDGSIPVAVENIKPEIVGSKKLSVTEVLPTATSYADSAAIANIRRHFLRSIKYAPSDQEVRRTGTTYFSFELDATGAMQNPVVVRSMSDGSKFELLRAAKNAPSFGGGVAGKYLLIVKYELSTSSLKDPQTLKNHSISQNTWTIKELTMRSSEAM
jgi:beta-lactamase regulating signal transducer with metallopeptidase domain